MRDRARWMVVKTWTGSADETSASLSAGFDKLSKVARILACELYISWMRWTGKMLWQTRASSLLIFSISFSSRDSLSKGWEWMNYSNDSLLLIQSLTSDHRPWSYRLHSVWFVKDRDKSGSHFSLQRFEFFWCPLSEAIFLSENRRVWILELVEKEVSHWNRFDFRAQKWCYYCIYKF